MIVSFFENNYTTWINYSNREDCIAIIDLTEDEISQINNWKDYELLEIKNKTCKINIYEWEKWKAKQLELQTKVNEEIKQGLENKKTSLLKEIWELKIIKDWMTEVWDDTTEITIKINTLISEYKNI